MHNRPRRKPDEPLPPERIKSDEKKLRLLRQLHTTVLGSIKSKQIDDSFLTSSALLLQKVPDIYTVWNARRAALETLLQDSVAARPALLKELKLTETCLRENPKSYCAWHHRLWLVTLGAVPLKEEIKNAEWFLELDARNFLVWAYRRKLVRLAGIAPEEEERFSAALIDKNFSNFSAWHNRAASLVDLHASQRIISLSDLVGLPQPLGEALLPQEALEAEFALAQEAFFTDPEDQSAYIYHCWLLSHSLAHWTASRGTPAEASAASVPPAGPTAHLPLCDPAANRVQPQVLDATLDREARAAEELLRVEPDRGRCKWPLLTLARLRELQAALQGDDSRREQARRIYAELEEVDPLRAGYYRDVGQDQCAGMACPP